MSEELNQNEETTPEAVVNTEAAAEVAPVAAEASATEEVAVEAPEAEEVAEETPAPVAEVEVVAEAPATVSAVEMDEEEGELDLTVVEEEEAFDWDKYESSSNHDAAYLEMEKRYEATLTTSVEHQVVSGVVVNKSDRDVIIDIGSKSEGVVSMNEFRYNPDLKVGDLVEVLVDKQEDKLGQLVLSHRKARSIKAWDRVNDAFLNEEVVQGYVKCRTKGGMIVDVFGLEAFLPGSQIDVKPIRDYDIFVDKTMEFKIVKINQEFKNVVYRTRRSSKPTWKNKSARSLASWKKDKFWKAWSRTSPATVYSSIWAASTDWCTSPTSLGAVSRIQAKW